MDDRLSNSIHNWCRIKPSISVVDPVDSASIYSSGPAIKYQPTIWIAVHGGRFFLDNASGIVNMNQKHQEPVLVMKDSQLCFT